MKRIEISKKPTKKDLEEAVEVLKAGGVVVYPTDTVYGLAVDAFNVEAIGKLFVLKKRAQKPLPIIVHNVSEAKNVSHIADHDEKIVKGYWPGAITFVFEKKDIVPNALTLGLPTVGIRIPASPVSILLTEMLGRPITSTSANISGEKVCTTIDEVMRQFRASPSLPDFFLDGGELSELPPSTVVDLSGKKPKVLREGPVKFTHK
ncbi:MAG: L-threonylcarbamoyladenylate synthase [Patescibacteria group bacterium]|jgi:L-threonylcarbamoyladenylate synthase